jgi:hypothetical protein
VIRTGSKRVEAGGRHIKLCSRKGCGTICTIYLVQSNPKAQESCGVISRAECERDSARD